MAPSRPALRFRVNPVEVAIFSIVSLIFLNSVYNLFYDRQGTSSKAMAQVASGQVERAPAAVTPAAPQAANLDVKCEAVSEMDTPAAMARLSGSLCGMAAAGEKFVKAEITNGANQFAATIFSDAEGRKYSTDNIPLAAGKNTISVVFSYQGEKGVVRTVAQSLNVTRK